ncbi:MAG TPA: nicotinate phosphoribosyltransferase [Polyangiaceae bacterium]|nr:nicotinate phosphoribosyltransferase [Polyangiaceae bacterium]
MDATRIDLYQLTSLVAHHAAGHSDDPVVMSFFSRRLPRDVATGRPVRGLLLFAGLGRCLDHLERARFDGPRIDALLAHPMLGPALARQPELVERLRAWRFSGAIRAPREGTPLVAGAAIRLDGTPLAVDGVYPAAYCPYLEVETDLLSAKLIETPLLSTINHMTMVASKALRVVRAARAQGSGRSVLEFGTRRTHPAAAIDAAIAAYVAGCSATSNVEAYASHGVPVSGTMDHFAIQAWERDGVPRHQTEEAFFRAFHELFPGRDVLLVDTYDTFGAQTGIRAAVAATDSAGPAGIRLDSALTRENIQRARRLLDELGATQTRIYVSGGMDEHKIAELGDVPIDGYGIGERIVTSPDAPVGVGAVGKLSEVRGQPTMKLSRGSGKATLPGRLQVWRTASVDRVGRLGEDHPGEPLLEPVWTRQGGRLPGPSLDEVRAHAARSVAALPPEALLDRQAKLQISDALARLVEACIERASHSS